MEERIMNEYKILGKNDNGSFAKIYKVSDDKNNIFAIKKLSLPLSDDLLLDFLKSGYLSRQEMNDYALSQIQKEINILERFKGNENILMLHEVKEENTLSGKNYYLRMEYATDIKTYFANNNFTDEEIIKMSIDICLALEELQKNNIVHTDIKPGNIFIANNKYKLGDFGSSIELDKEAPKTIFGTMNYMAPEVYKGQKVDLTTDVYSLGLVMYTLLNGNLPFISSTTPSNIAFERRMNGEKLPVIFGIKEKLMSIIIKACSFEKENRYKNISEMKNDLINYNSNVNGVEIKQNEPAKKTIMEMFSQPIQKQQKVEQINNFTPIENEPTISIYDTELLNISKKNAVEFNSKKKKKIKILKNYKLRKYAGLVLLMLIVPSVIYANYSKNKTCDYGYINVAGRCLKGRYTCPEEYTLNNDNKCQKVKQTEEPEITRKCIDDTNYYYDNDTGLCKPNPRVSKTPRTRPTCGSNGAKYNSSTGKCDLVVSAAATPVQYCPEGYNIGGDRCVKNISAEKIAATEILDCPSGYTLKDRSCTKQTTTKKNVSSYLCSKGDTLVDNNKKCQATTERTCIKYYSYVYGYVQSTVCETYGCNDSKYTYNQSTLKCEYKYDSTPICDSGYTLSSDPTKCEKTEKASEAAKSSFKCPSSEYILSGQYCLKGKVETTNVLYRYACAQGRLGNDNKCYVTQSLDAGIEPYCQDGYELDGVICMKKGLKEHPPVVSYKCTRTYTLNEGRCESYTYKTAVPELD